ncbi:CE1 family esterase [Acinetobacter baylyi]|uniref:alpha/beta hydrolase family esterase n=1 Tax=Acinetobacter baylyi TaxID=202950 RepID=UPI001D18FC36|nr:dienelactone hydrolase family protein [Acinetobacter baylyi]
MLNNKIKMHSSSKQLLNSCLLSTCLMATIFAMTQTQAGWFRDRLEKRMEQRQSPSQASHSADITEQQIMVDGIERNYQVYNPFPKRKDLPVVIALHGGGGNATQMMKRWQDEAKQQGFIVVAPQGVGRSERVGTWNAIGCCGEAVQQQVNDVKFIQMMLTKLKNQVSIDSKKVYAVGFSNGGMLTHQLAIQMGNQLAGVAVVSGALFGNEPQTRTAVPIMIIHGLKDDVVAFDGGMSPTQFVAKAQRQPSKPTPYSVDYWLRANQCQSSITRPSQDNIIVQSGQHCKADVMFYKLVNGQHKWPTLDSSDEKLDATRTIWNFFNQRR